MVKTSELLIELQGKLAQLERRIQLLEHPVLAVTPAPDLVSEEIMLTIAAAVAAYLGERAHIRVVRLVPSHAWAQQGRVSIQASHQWAHLPA